MQVLLGSLTTGLSALAASGGKSVNIFLRRLSEALTRDVIVPLKTAAATTVLGMLFSETCHFNEFRRQWNIILI